LGRRSLSCLKPTFTLLVLIGQQSAATNSKLAGPALWKSYLGLFHKCLCPCGDASRLELPLELDDTTSYRILDSKPAVSSHEIRQSPFKPDHVTQLRHMLKAWTAHVQSGEWRVISNGVSEPATELYSQDVKADSEEDAMKWSLILLDIIPI
jgi:hypothetical protein